MIFIGFTIARSRSVRRLLYRQGAKMLIRGKNKHLLDASRRRNFHGEVAPNGLDITRFHDLVGSS
jgi:hypothetical protein